MNKSVHYPGLDLLIKVRESALTATAVEGPKGPLLPQTPFSFSRWFLLRGTSRSILFKVKFGIAAALTHRAVFHRRRFLQHSFFESFCHCSLLVASSHWSTSSSAPRLQSIYNLYLLGTRHKATKSFNFICCFILFRFPGPENILQSTHTSWRREN